MAVERVEGAAALRSKFAGLEAVAYPRALARAINRVANTVKSVSAKAISDATGLKQSSVRRRIVFRKRATIADPTALLDISGRPLNLVEFVSGSKSEPRRARGGLTANAWGNRRKYPGVFLARMSNGQVIAVQRSAAGRARTKLIASGRWKGKSPHIEAVFGPGVAREAAQPALARARSETVRARLPIELRHEIDFETKRLIAKAGKKT